MSIAKEIQRRLRELETIECGDNHVEVYAHAPLWYSRTMREIPLMRELDGELLMLICLLHFDPHKFSAHIKNTFSSAYYDVHTKSLPSQCLDEIIERKLSEHPSKRDIKDLMKECIEGNKVSVCNIQKIIELIAIHSSTLVL
jgi:hypothetical protein